ncbi:hypothetical protein GCM10025789_05100 [Tessaracoccus lubricantis]|uniref:Metal-dependent phosphohydrolase n=1 Tax=Tessaracoccus lubricantis TaxID=545543 RepID=A0ABP9F180_9ACTN
MVRQEVLPAGVAAELLARWQEPHRRYHGVTHLDDGLAVLEQLGGGDLEKIAYWCHDAVHTNSSPTDELASAEVARALLAPHLTPGEVDEVCRLVLVTVSHLPAPEDERGARVADADLHGLGLPWDAYVANLAAIRAELPGLSDAGWRERRQAFAARMLQRPHIFATEVGRQRWEVTARDNLEREVARESL